MFEQKSTPYPNPERDRLLWEIQELITLYGCHGTEQLEKRREHERLVDQCCYGLRSLYVVLDNVSFTDEQRVAWLRAMRESLDVSFRPHSYCPIPKNQKTPENP